MTRTRYAASGNLPLGGEKKKSEGCTLLVKIARKINPLDDPPRLPIISELKVHRLFQKRGKKQETKVQYLGHPTMLRGSSQLKWSDNTLMLLFGTITHQDETHIFASICFPASAKLKKGMYLFTDRQSPGNILILSTSC